MIVLTPDATFALPHLAFLTQGNRCQLFLDQTTATSVGSRRSGPLAWSNAWMAIHGLVDPNALLLIAAFGRLANMPGAVPHGIGVSVPSAFENGPFIDDLEQDRRPGAGLHRSRAVHCGSTGGGTAGYGASPLRAPVAQREFGRGARFETRRALFPDHFSNERRAIDGMQYEPGGAG